MCVKLSVLFAITLLLCGCACRKGRCYPVIGFGWVTVQTGQPTAVTSTALGLNTGAGQVNLGLSSFTTITIATNANVILELRK